MNKQLIFNHAAFYAKHFGTAFTDLMVYMERLFDLESKIGQFPIEYSRSCPPGIVYFCRECLGFKTEPEIIGYTRFIVSEESFKLLREVNIYLQLNTDFNDL